MQFIRYKNLAIWPCADGMGGHYADITDQYGETITQTQIHTTRESAISEAKQIIDQLQEQTKP